MRIGIDARFYGPEAKGLGRYNQKLLEELEKLDAQNEYVVFLRQDNFDEFLPRGKNFKKVLADFKWYSWGEQFIFPFLIYRQRVDLMHFTHFNAPLFYFRPLVITIHDLILQRWPTHRNNFLSRARYFFKSLVYKVVIYSALLHAKKIITVSQFVKKDIINCFGAAEDKILVVYEGAPEVASSKAPGASSILKKYGLQSPYLLYVGNAYPHKNLSRLIEAFKILRHGQYQNLQLVLVGGDDYFYKKLKQDNCDSAGICFGGGVIFTGYVPDQELGTLYENASLYVFPSLCEGFGLPPLEAMAYDVPVAASNATCLPEILGEAAYFFDAQDVQDMAKKIDDILTDDSLRQRLVTAGRERIKKYSWRKMAAKIKEIYQN